MMKPSAGAERSTPPAPDRECANVLGVPVDSIDMEGTLARAAELLHRSGKGYVCAASAHGVLESRQDACVARAFSEASIVIPDGRPMVWVARMQGKRAIRQVTGPDLMAAIIAGEEFAGCSHFFYGGKPGVAQDLADAWMKRFPGTRVAGTYTPPFRDLTSEEEAELVQRLNRLEPDFIWIGISAPRQELLMRRLLPHLRHGLLFGVGAAFDFHTGRIRQCAPWIKRVGFQWLHRLMQDPRRLWRRNLYNSTFLWHIALQLTGLRKYRIDAPLHQNADCPRPQPASASSSSVVESA
jgi:N-acetylglucosaminyldiphosphoundecaprenol N-acetyl-beta-D-mannosaminyltransferase